MICIILPTQKLTAVMIGKLTLSSRVAFAMNHAASATAHMIPDTRPGKMACGYTLGLFFITIQYIAKYTVLDSKIPLKWANTKFKPAKT